MDASHILVGVLTATSFGFLVWIEICSRRNRVETEHSPTAPVPETVIPPKKRRRRQ